MFNMGVTEMMIIGVIALVVIGPQKLPDIARVVGRSLKEFKKAANEFKMTVKEELEEDTGSELKEIRNMASGIKKETGNPKNIEDCLETMADVLEAADKDNRQENRARRIE